MTSRTCQRSTESWIVARSAFCESSRGESMSVQFGRWNVDGSPIDLPQLEMVKSTISSYGPDNGGCYVKKHVALLYCALHTTNESLREAQPLVLPSGSVITWDGRLDNRDDLIRDL